MCIHIQCDISSCKTVYLQEDSKLETGNSYSIFNHWIWGYGMFGQTSSSNIWINGLKPHPPRITNWGTSKLVSVVRPEPGGGGYNRRKDDINKKWTLWNGSNGPTGHPFKRVIYKTKDQAARPTTGRNIRWIDEFHHVSSKFFGNLESPRIDTFHGSLTLGVLSPVWCSPSPLGYTKKSTLQTSLIYETSMNWSSQNAAQGAESGEFQHRLFTKGRFKGHITFECTANTYIEYIKLQCITQNYTTATLQYTLQLKVAHVGVVVWVSHKPHTDFGGLMFRLFLALKMSRKKNLKHEIWWNVHAVMKRSFGNCLTNTLCICTIKRDEMTCV